MACPASEPARADDQLELLSPAESRSLLDTFDSVPPEGELRVLWGNR